MKIKLIAFFLLFGLNIFYAQYSIVVNIKNISSTKGNIQVALYNTEKNFLKKNYKSLKGFIHHNTSQVIFKNIPKGIYAISLYHDENANQKIDLGLFGIPKEPYGCSNGAKGFMGPPKFDDAQFVLNQNKQLVIYLN